MDVHSDIPGCIDNRSLRRGTAATSCACGQRQIAARDIVVADMGPSLLFVRQTGILPTVGAESTTTTLIRQVRGCAIGSAGRQIHFSSRHAVKRNHRHISRSQPQRRGKLAVVIC